MEKYTGKRRGRPRKNMEPAQANAQAEGQDSSDVGQREAIGSGQDVQAVDYRARQRRDFMIHNQIMSGIRSFLIRK